MVTAKTKKKQQNSKLGVKLGANISDRRKKLGWTQADLAEKLGVETETISRFERGSNLPSLPRLEKLADTLNLSLSKLLGTSSSRADDQAEVVSEWLSALKDRDREFVLSQIKRLCTHLSSSKG